MSILQRPYLSPSQPQILQQLRQLPGVWLIVGMLLVNLGNYGFSIGLGRWLGPQAFAEINLIVTLFALATLVSGGLQIKAAHASAHSNHRSQLRSLRRFAWSLGLSSLLGLGVGAAFWQRIFNTSTTSPFIVLGFGLTGYYVLGVERGIMQSQANFGRLVWNFMLEMLVRLSGAILVIKLDLGVTEASLAISSSVLIAWAFSQNRQLAHSSQQTSSPALKPLWLLLGSQGLLSSADVLLVTAWASNLIAGQYAALALIGRLGLFISATINTINFSAILRTDQPRSQHYSLLWQSLGQTFAIGMLFSIACWAIGDLIVIWLFGAAYLPIASVLWVYAATASCYGLTSILVNYQLAQQRQTGIWLTLGASIIQTAAYVMFQQTINQLLLIQALVMIGLLVLVSCNQWLDSNAKPR